MEVVAIVVATVLTLWWIGAFKSIGKLIDMGNTEINQLSKDQFVNHIDRSKKRNVKQADVEKALANDALIEQYIDAQR